MNTIEEIYYLIKLCPQMIYLKLDSINNMDMELFWKKINMNVMNIFIYCVYMFQQQMMILLKK
jgi:hypothetical protein